MDKKIALGLIFLIISVIFSFSNLTLTGNVISFNYSSYFSLISILSFIFGVILVVTAKNLEESIKEAIKEGVPPLKAEEIFENANKKVESGEWVELRAFRVRDTSDQEKYPGATSLCRYWGPKEYKELSNAQLDRLYREGKIGKTHEVVRGSDKYKIGGSLEKKNLSMPYPGSRVLHRHWEIAQMYRYKKKSG